MVLANLGLLAAASLPCVAAADIRIHSVGRNAHGFATVPATLLIHESFPPPPARRWISACSGAITIGPTLAPVAGP